MNTLKQVFKPLYAILVWLDRMSGEIFFNDNSIVSQCVDALLDNSYALSTQHSFTDDEDMFSLPSSSDFDDSSIEINDWLTDPSYSFMIGNIYHTED